MNDDTDDIDDTDTVKKRVTITIEDYPLPLLEDVREKVLEGLKDGIQEIPDECVEPASITTKTGYQYAQIDDSCPCCGGRLELRDYTYLGKGACAEANCADSDCGWRGSAVYRLVDLEGGPGAAVESAVISGEATPSYHPY